MFARWVLAAILGIGFATAADALIIPRNIGTVGVTGIQLAVYPGCTAAPPGPDSYSTSKDWYFNPNPSIGHPPAYYAGVAAITAPGTGGPTSYTQYGLGSGLAVSDVTNPGVTGSLAAIVVQNGGVIDVLPFSWGSGIQNGDTMTVASGSIGNTAGFTFTYRTPDPQSVWGNSTHPFDALISIGGQSGFDLWPNGWGGPMMMTLSGVAWYNSRGNAAVQDFTPANIQTGDPNHFRAWPGDTILIQGDPTFNYLASTASLNFGSTVGGPIGQHSQLYTDAAGNTKWLWIKADPSKPVPLIYGANVVSVRGVIIQGLGLGHPNSNQSTTVAQIALPFGSLQTDGVALPTDGAVTLQLGAAGDTINELWTYKTTVSSSNQIAIGSSWLDVLYNTFEELLADPTALGVLNPHLNGSAFGFSWRIGAGSSTTVSFTLSFVSHQTNVASGSTVVVNGSTYTAGTDFAIGATLPATWSNFAAFIATAQPTVTVTELTPTSIQLVGSSGGVAVDGVAGAHLVRFTGITEPIGFEKLAATMPATYLNPVLSDHIFQVSGTQAFPTSDVIIYGNSVGSWDVGEQYAGNFATYFPTGNSASGQADGSLGYNVETGAHGTPGGAWNAFDVAAQEGLAIQVSGQYYAAGGPNKSSTQIAGASCVSAQNNYIHHAFTLEANDTTNTLQQGNIVNYSGNDSMDSYGAIFTTWQGNTIINPLYAYNGVHSDGLQTGTGSGFTIADMGNPAFFPSVIGYPGIFAPHVNIIGNQFYSVTDSALNSSTFHDMFNTPVTMANANLSWTQGTEPIVDSVFADNVFYAEGEVQFAIVTNTVFANNTGLIPGIPSSDWGGNIFVGLKTEFSSVQPYPAGNSYYNNLLNVMQISPVSGRSCSARNDTFASNLLIPPVSNGTLTGNVAYVGCTITNSGTTNFSAGGSTNKSAESCGVIVNPQPGVAAACGFPTITNFAPFLTQAYAPLNTGMWDPTTLNGQPPNYPSSTGPLVGAGTAAAGVPTTNAAGLPWPTGTPNIGAW